MLNTNLSAVYMSADRRFFFIESILRGVDAFSKSKCISTCKIYFTCGGFDTLYATQPPYSHNPANLKNLLKTESFRGL